MTDEQLIQDFASKASRAGWQIISQQPTSIQIKKPKKFNRFLLIGGLVLLVVFGAGILLLIFGLIDYAFQVERMEYVTASDIRSSKIPKLGRDNGPLILAAVILGAVGLCIAVIFLAGAIV